MGLLDSFEKGLERAVNGAFAKTFRSGIQPVEIASALRAELDKQAAVVSRERILAPNTFTVLLSATDDAKMSGFGSSLHQELVDTVKKHAVKQGYSFAGPVSVTLSASDSQSTGTLTVQSETAQANEVAWRAVVDIDGQRHVLSKARTIIGRGSDADITVNDANTSRHHVEILWDGSRGMMRDLGSTNGSKLDGVKTASGRLESDSTITIGKTSIVFRVVPQTKRQPRHDPSPATRIFDGNDLD